jgi:hypothetical protein
VLQVPALIAGIELFNVLLVQLSENGTGITGIIYF